LLTKTSLWGA